LGNLRLHQSDERKTPLRGRGPATGRRLFYGRGFGLPDRR
jgi:hypothetical protein